MKINIAEVQNFVINKLLKNLNEEDGHRGDLYDSNYDVNFKKTIKKIMEVNKIADPDDSKHFQNTLEKRNNLNKDMGLEGPYMTS